MEVHIFHNLVLMMCTCKLLICVWSDLLHAGKFWNTFFLFSCCLLSWWLHHFVYYSIVSPSSMLFYSHNCRVNLLTEVGEHVFTFSALNRIWSGELDYENWLSLRHMLCMFRSLCFYASWLSLGMCPGLSFALITFWCFHPSFFAQFISRDK